MRKQIIFSFFIIVFLTFKGISQEQNIPELKWYLKTKDKSALLYIHEIGDGEPILVLHGGPGAGLRYMLNISKGLTKKYKFIFYDQRGFGLSTTPDSISMSKHLEDIESLREAYEMKKISLISHSYGTMLAMNYLQEYPQNVKNIVLIGALDPKNGKADFFSKKELKLFSEIKEIREEFHNRNDVKRIIEKEGLNRKVLSSKQQHKLRHIKQAAANIYNMNKWKDLVVLMIDNYNATKKTMSSTNFQYDWTEILSKHPFKITVINGVYDFVVGPKGSPIWKRVVKKEAKNVNLVLIDKASHNCWIDEPEIFRTELEKALK